jgi:hypothetical protein
VSVFGDAELVDPRDDAGASSGVKPPPTPTPTPPPTPPPATCGRSATLVSGKSACQGQLIFEDNFSTLDPARWEHDVRIAGSPVSEVFFLRRR